jgi:hypothetical protein
MRFIHAVLGYNGMWVPYICSQMTQKIADIDTVIKIAVVDSGGLRRWLRISDRERTYALYQVLWRLTTAGVVIQGIAGGI